MKKSSNVNFLALLFLQVRSKCSGLKLLLFALGFLTVYSVFSMQNNNVYSTPDDAVKDYLVWSPNCKIPRIPILNEETMPIFKPEPYKTCKTKEPLTYILKLNNTATLYIDHIQIINYDENGVKCCVKYVKRNEMSPLPDYKIQYTKCVSFMNKIVLEDEFVLVTCNGTKSRKTVYDNAYSVVLIKPEVQIRMDEYKRRRKKSINSDSNSNDNDNSNVTKRPYNVLMLGIDSMSRLHFYRTLPKTAKFLRQSDWIELEGYNKIGDNTYPNLCAVLLGKNYRDVSKKCLQTDTAGGLDSCGFIWDRYRNNYYVTAYAEDTSSINTFSYLRKGFKKPPTDYYLMPFVVAAERNLHLEYEHLMEYCVGPVQSSERILKYAAQFTKTFKDHPFFGFFWMNSFSHNDFNEPTRMDNVFLDYMKRLHGSSIIDDTIIIFLSDHGYIFGDVVETRTGWYENRLPMLNVWIPQRFRREHKDKFEHLLSNARKLSSPFDLYLTLQDILEISSGATAQKTEACPECTSLFRPIPEERICEDAAINPQWCTCYDYQILPFPNETIAAAAPFVVQKLNEMLEEGVYNENETMRCATLSLKETKRITVSSALKMPSGKPFWYLQVLISTEPGLSVFEGTVKLYYDDESFKPVYELMEEPNRLSYYGSSSRCVNNIPLKRYCFCTCDCWYDYIFQMNFYLEKMNLRTSLKYVPVNKAVSNSITDYFYKKYFNSIQ